MQKIALINPSSLKLQTYLILFNILTLTIFFSLFVTPILLSEISTSELFASEKLINAGNELVKSSQIESNEWTPQEKWVWDCICKGEIADLNKFDGYDNKLDPKSTEGWHENRIIRPSFLKAIIFNESYSNNITKQGIKISGAWFKELLDLLNATLDYPLFFYNSRFDSTINFNSLKSSSSIILTNSSINDMNLNGAKIKGSLGILNTKVNKILTMTSLDVDGYLYMDKNSDFKEVNLLDARVGKQLVISNSKFEGKLNMDSVKINEDLIIRGNLEFTKEVDLHNAAVYGNMNISDAKFVEKLNMNSLYVGGGFTTESSITLNKVHLEFNDVSLLKAKITNQLTITHSKFNGKLDMDSIEVSADLIIRGNLEFLEEVKICNAKIKGQLIINDAKSTHDFIVSSTEVGKGLYIQNNSYFNNLYLQRAKIESLILIDESNFSGTLALDSLKVVGDLFMTKSNFNFVNLRNAKIFGSLSIFESNFIYLNTDSLEVGNDLITKNNNFNRKVEMPSIKIKNNFNISEDKLPSLNLNNAQIEGELLLCAKDNKFTQWEQGSIFTLRNAKVESLKILAKSWPNNIELDGFLYTQISTSESDGNHNISVRDLKDWLRKQKHYAPKPYEYLSGILQKEGYKKESKYILYTSLERKRKETATWMQWLLLTFSKLFNGYGYYKERLLIQMIILYIIGTLIIWSDKKGREIGSKKFLIYSLFMMIDYIHLNYLFEKVFIRLNEAFLSKLNDSYRLYLNFKHNNFRKYYFLVHKIYGCVLIIYGIYCLLGIVRPK